MLSWILSWMPCDWYEKWSSHFAVRQEAVLLKHLSNVTVIGLFQRQISHLRYHARTWNSDMETIPYSPRLFTTMSNMAVISINDDISVSYLHQDLTSSATWSGRFFPNSVVSWRTTPRLSMSVTTTIDTASTEPCFTTGARKPIYMRCIHSMIHVRSLVVSRHKSTIQTLLS